MTSKKSRASNLIVLAESEMSIKCPTIFNSIIYVVKPFYNNAPGKLIVLLLSTHRRRIEYSQPNYGICNSILVLFY